MTPELAVVRHPDHVQWLGVVEGCGSHRNTFSFLIYYTEVGFICNRRAKAVNTDTVWLP
jgi:hypothetical protein